MRECVLSKAVSKLVWGQKSRLTDNNTNTALIIIIKMNCLDRRGRGEAVEGRCH